MSSTLATLPNSEPSRDEVDQAVFKAKKITRTLLRLKLSLLADDVLNVVLTRVESAIRQAHQRGEGASINVGALVDQAYSEIDFRKFA